jgi:hypothetical protein
LVVGIFHEVQSRVLVEEGFAEGEEGRTDVDEGFEVVMAEMVFEFFGLSCGYVYEFIKLNFKDLEQFCLGFLGIDVHRQLQHFLLRQNRKQWYWL